MQPSIADAPSTGGSRGEHFEIVTVNGASEAGHCLQDLSSSQGLHSTRESGASTLRALGRLITCI
eukprot:1883857-Amphidinium_carterae.2